MAKKTVAGAAPAALAAFGRHPRRARLRGRRHPGRGERGQGGLNGGGGFGAVVFNRHLRVVKLRLDLQYPNPLSDESREQIMAFDWLVEQKAWKAVASSVA